MPLTLPSHAAAILPLYRLAPRLLHPTALVIGCCGPDLTYLLRLESLPHSAHTPAALLYFCLPVGLLLFVWAQGLILPALSQLAPRTFGVALGRFARVTRWPRGPRAWAGVVLSIGLGALTHLLWDGFTHAGLWPARVLYPDVRVPIGARGVPLTHLVQHASTLIGGGIVIGYLARLYARLPGQPQDDTAGARRRGTQLLLCLSLCFAAAFALRWGLAPSGERIGLRLWASAWTAALLATVALTIFCAAARRTRSDAAAARRSQRE